MPSPFERQPADSPARNRQAGLEQYDPDSGLMPMGYGDAGRR
jgi:hypothetical protein